MLPTKEQVLGLLESCASPGAKVAIALAAFGGLGPGQVKKLAFRSLVEFSLTKKRFSKIPSRIQMREAVGSRRASVVRYYTFLSSRGCEWLLRDLKSRPQPRAESSVVTGEALKEAESGIRAAGLRWHDLRDYFHVCFDRALSSSSAPVDFMLGHVIKEDEMTHVWRFDPQRIEWMRDRYVEVEKQFFSG